jgi:hypothetical protein
MPIATSLSQANNSFRDHYVEAGGSDDETTRNLGQAMLKWIDKLDKLIPNDTVWGLTSLYQLVLMPTDQAEGPWAVKIVGFDKNYQISYLLPSEKSPWKEAYVQVTTEDLDEAVEMTITALKESGYWHESDFDQG